MKSRPRLNMSLYHLRDRQRNARRLGLFFVFTVVAFIACGVTWSLRTF